MPLTNLEHKKKDFNQVSNKTGFILYTQLLSFHNVSNIE